MGKPPFGRVCEVTCDPPFGLGEEFDVLEHMRSQGDVLRFSARAGRAGVDVFADIRYWDAVLRIAFGADFPQEDSGIFDRTHLRFFTEKSMRVFLAENGFEMIWMRGISPTPSRKLMALNLVTQNKFQECQYLQYLILAKPALAETTFPQWMLVEVVAHGQKQTCGQSEGTK